MNVYPSALAQKELQAAVSYYDEISSALGDECRFRQTSNTNSAQLRTVIPEKLEQTFR